jgi:hypothetical protein
MEPMPEYIPRSKRRQKERPRYLKFIVPLVIALNVGFTIGVFYVFYHVGSEPKELIRFWFGFTTTELLVAYGIKKLDPKKETKPENPTDVNY